jgi:hypothetical protein
MANPHETAKPRSTAEIVSFPLVFHRSTVDQLVNRLRRYDQKRAAFFLQSEMQKAFERRLKLGVPEERARRDVMDLWVCVRGRLAEQHLTRGGAA